MANNPINTHEQLQTTDIKNRNRKKPESDSVANYLIYFAIGILVFIALAYFYHTTEPVTSVNTTVAPPMVSDTKGNEQSGMPANNSTQDPS